MYVVPMHRDSIEIDMVQIGCCKYVFDWDYPTRLNGIISKTEFEESITNINSIISAKPRIICSLIILISSIGGFIMFVVSTTQISKLTAAAFVLLGLGLSLFCFGICSSIFGCCIIDKRLARRLRPVIENESKKYSTRSPISCSWRLRSKTVTRGRGGHGRIDVILHIIIDFVHSVNPASRSIPYQPTEPTAPPPPYESLRIENFCSQCGMTRAHSSAKFCTSCGQPFHL